MLELSDLLVANVAEALHDNSPDTSWWLDPRSGEVEPWSADSLWDSGDEHPGERGLLPVEPVGSRTSYRDMEDFAAGVADARSRDLLERALGDRGAFRRFRDTLFDLPELQDAWAACHRARTERRAVEWLAEEGLVDPGSAEAAIRARPDPPVPGPRTLELARAVAADLRGLYGPRLREVLLFGSWARGDAHPESDIDLLVVLDRVESRWAERRRMDEILWRRSHDNDAVVVVLPVDEHAFARRAEPVLARAAAEGVSIG